MLNLACLNRCDCLKILSEAIWAILEVNPIGQKLH